MKKAFSLIELIVVVTIIALLTVAGVVNYATSNKKSRDARRISDLEKMRMALEMVRQVGVTYPASISSLSPTYLQTIPTDPKSGTYLYTPGATYYTYTIWAKMEDLGSTTGSYSSGSYNYQVSNP